MEIQLAKDWRLHGERNHYTIQRLLPAIDRKTKKKKLQWENDSYYSMLEHALESFVEAYVRASDVKTLKEVNDTINNMKALRESFMGLK